MNFTNSLITDTVIPGIELIKKGKIKALKGNKLKGYIGKRIKSLK